MNRSLIRRLDLVSLQLFIAVCEEGTLARAAEREAIAISAISKRLGDLEAHLNVALFHRKARGMVPTRAGEALLHHARSVVRSVEKLGEELDEFSRGVRGYVRILANISSIVQFLPEDISSFLALHQQIKVDMQEMPSVQVLRSIEERLGDVGVCCATGYETSLQTLFYRRDHLMVVVREDHSLASLAEITFAETVDFDCVALHPSSAIFTLIQREAARLGRSLRCMIHVPSYDGLCRMIQAGLGIGIVPSGAFDVAARGLGLRAIRLTDSWANREMHVVTANREALSRPAQLFVDHLVGASLGPATA
ncbi:LysR family transcriptional regulator [Bradyrhizobium sp. STM 3562]|uniref:LysR family transcriptional regulator n=1 Tax=Bradyrhizobium sp. STM 3562 TaxID=578924 RepID=UPI00388F22C2